MATGDDSPHAVMGRLAEQLGDPARAIKEYRALLAHDHTAIEAARRLAELAEKANDQTMVAFATDRIVALDPFDASGHTGLGRLALRSRDAPVAMREFKVALAIGPADRASAHCDLAESYLLAGRPADAKREALAALEIAPSFERAQDLLLKAIDGGRHRPRRMPRRSHEHPAAGDRSSRGRAPVRDRCQRAGRCRGAEHLPPRHPLRRPAMDLRPHPLSASKLPGLSGCDTYDEPWTIDYPAAEQNLSRRVKTVTSIQVNEPAVVDDRDPDLWTYPWIYLVEPGTWVPTTTRSRSCASSSCAAAR